MNSRLIRGAVALVALALANGCTESDSPVAPAGEVVLAAAAAGKTVLPTGTGMGTRESPPLARTKYRIEAHDNRFVMPATSNIYLIWYGSWTGDSSQTILTDLVTSLGGSSYFGITRLYPRSDGYTPSGGLVYGGAIADPFSRGATLARADVDSLISSALMTGALPVDPRGIYAVMLSPDVYVDGFASEHCAYHGHMLLNGSTMKYVVVGGPARSPARCAATLAGPNGDFTADNMAPLLAAQLANAVTDPQLVGWYDRLGLEMADKCAWDFGTTYTAPNGAPANLQLGRRHWLLQRLWVPSKSGGSCRMAP